MSGLFLLLHPEFLIIVGIRVHHICIHIRDQCHLSREVQWRDGVLDRSDFGAGHTAESDGLHAYLIAIRKLGSKVSFEPTFSHIQLPSEIFHFSSVEV